MLDIVCLTFSWIDESSVYYKTYVSNQFRNCKGEDFIISPLDTRESVKDLKKGKRAGLDNVSSEHYKYTSDNRMYFFH